MKMLVTSDLQLSDIPRDDYRWAFFKTLRQLAKDHAVDRVLILGDLCEEKDRHGASLVNKVVDQLTLITARICPVIILKGNHDYIDPTIPFYGFLKHIKDLEWIGIPTTYEAGSHRYLFLPHTRDHKTDWKGLKLYNYDLIFAHNTFEGVKTAHGQDLAGIPNIFEGRQVISGDVHTPQTIDNITYVGAPYTVDFGDTYNPRVLLVNKNNVTSIPVEGPQKRLVEVHWPKIKADVVNPGDVVKVRIFIAADQYMKWDEIKRKVHQWGEDKEVRIDTIQPVVEEAARVRIKEKYLKRTDEEIFREYCKSKGVDERTMKAGLAILEEE